MADRARLTEALQRANKAGDIYAVRELASEIHRMDAQDYSLSGKAPQDMGYLEQFAGGAKHAWDRAASGLEGIVKGPIEDLTGSKFGRDVTPTQLEQGRQFVRQTGPMSTAGEIAGDVAIQGGPIGGTVRAAVGLPLVRRALAAGAAGGAMNLLTTPGDSLAPAAIGAAGAGAPVAAGGLVQAGRSMLPKALQAMSNPAVAVGTGVGSIEMLKNMPEFVRYVNAHPELFAAVAGSAIANKLPATSAVVGEEAAKQYGFGMEPY